MPPHRSKQQLREVGDFVKRLYVMADAASWADFARQARVPYPNITRWKDGKAEPSGWNLYCLINVALESEAGRLEAIRDGVSSPLEAQIQKLASVMTQTRTLVAEGLDLQERLRELEAEPQPPQEDHPPQAETQ